MDKALARLRRLQQHLNSREVGQSVARLKDIRDQELAHIDVLPEYFKGKPTLSDIYRAFVFAANVVNTATVVATKRLVLTKTSYYDARN